SVRLASASKEGVPVDASVGVSSNTRGVSWWLVSHRTRPQSLGTGVSCVVPPSSTGTCLACVVSRRGHLLYITAEVGERAGGEAGADPTPAMPLTTRLGDSPPQPEGVDGDGVEGVGGGASSSSSDLDVALQDMQRVIQHNTARPDTLGEREREMTGEGEVGAGESSSPLFSPSRVTDGPGVGPPPLPTVSGAPTRPRPMRVSVQDSDPAAVQALLPKRAPYRSIFAPGAGSVLSVRERQAWGALGMTTEGSDSESDSEYTMPSTGTLRRDAKHPLVQQGERERERERERETEDVISFMDLVPSQKGREAHAGSDTLSDTLPPGSSLSQLPPLHTVPVDTAPHVPSSVNNVSLLDIDGPLLPGCILTLADSASRSGSSGVHWYRSAVNGGPPWSVIPSTHGSVAYEVTTLDIGHRLRVEVESVSGVLRDTTPLITRADAEGSARGHTLSLFPTHTAGSGGATAREDREPPEVASHEALKSTLTAHTVSSSRRPAPFSSTHLGSESEESSVHPYATSVYNTTSESEGVDMGGMDHSMQTESEAYPDTDPTANGDVDRSRLDIDSAARLYSKEMAVVPGLDLSTMPLPRSRTSLNRKGRKAARAALTPVTPMLLPPAPPTTLAGCVMVFTGVLPGVSRDRAVHYVKGLGASTKRWVGRSVTHLVAGEIAGPSKLDKASELGIPVIGLAGLLGLVQMSIPGGTSDVFTRGARDTHSGGERGADAIAARGIGRGRGFDGGPSDPPERAQRPRPGVSKGSSTDVQTLCDAETLTSVSLLEVGVAERGMGRGVGGESGGSAPSRNQGQSKADHTSLLRAMKGVAVGRKLAPLSLVPPPPLTNVSPHSALRAGLSSHSNQGHSHAATHVLSHTHTGGTTDDTSSDGSRLLPVAFDASGGGVSVYSTYDPNEVGETASEASTGHHSYLPSKSVRYRNPLPSSKPWDNITNSTLLAHASDRGGVYTPQEEGSRPSHGSALHPVTTRVSKQPGPPLQRGTLPSLHTDSARQPREYGRLPDSVYGQFLTPAVGAGGGCESVGVLMAVPVSRERDVPVEQAYAQPEHETHASPLPATVVPAHHPSPGSVSVQTAVSEVSYEPLPDVSSPVDVEEGSAASQDVTHTVDAVADREREGVHDSESRDTLAHATPRDPDTPGCVEVTATRETTVVSAPPHDTLSPSESVLSPSPMEVERTVPHVSDAVPAVSVVGTTGQSVDTQDHVLTEPEVESIPAITSPGVQSTVSPASLPSVPSLQDEASTAPHPETVMAQSFFPDVAFQEVTLPMHHSASSSHIHSTHKTPTQVDTSSSSTAHQQVEQGVEETACLPPVVPVDSVPAKVQVSDPVLESLKSLTLPTPPVSPAMADEASPAVETHIDVGTCDVESVLSNGRDGGIDDIHREVVSTYLPTTQPDIGLDSEVAVEKDPALDVEEVPDVPVPAPTPPRRSLVERLFLYSMDVDGSSPAVIPDSASLDIPMSPHTVVAVPTTLDAEIGHTQDTTTDIQDTATRDATEESLPSPHAHVDLSPSDEVESLPIEPGIEESSPVQSSDIVVAPTPTVQTATRVHISSEAGDEGVPHPDSLPSHDPVLESLRSLTLPLTTKPQSASLPVSGSASPTIPSGDHLNRATEGAFESITLGESQGETEHTVSVPSTDSLPVHPLATPECSVSPAPSSASVSSLTSPASAVVEGVLEVMGLGGLGVEQDTSEGVELTETISVDKDGSGGQEPTMDAAVDTLAGSQESVAVEVAETMATLSPVVEVVPSSTATVPVPPLVTDPILESLRSLSLPVPTSTSLSADTSPMATLATLPVVTSLPVSSASGSDLLDQSRQGIADAVNGDSTAKATPSLGTSMLLPPSPGALPPLPPSAAPSSVSSLTSPASAVLDNVMGIMGLGDVRKAERAEVERLKAEKLDAERLDAERLEAARLEAERLEAERHEAERVETERLEAERLEAEKAEADRLEAEGLEAERLGAERLGAERLGAEKAEADRLESERLEAERLEAERVEAESLEAQKLEAERLEAERLEAQKLEAERLETERVEAERLEAEKLEAERLEA
ncbi:hypothetical protein KIPB_008243, partial [Kipferlia bialata]